MDLDRIINGKFATQSSQISNRIGAIRTKSTNPWITTNESSEQLQDSPKEAEKNSPSAPLFVSSIGQFENHLILRRMYKGLVDTSQSQPCLRIRVMVAGSINSRKSEFVESFFSRRISYSNWKAEGDFRVRSCRIGSAPFEFAVKMIESLDFDRKEENWSESLEKELKKRIKNSTEKKQKKILTQPAQEPAKDRDECVHFLIYCLQGAGLSSSEVLNLKKLESLVHLVPIYCLRNPISEDESNSLKRLFQENKRVQSINWLGSDHRSQKIKPEFPILAVTQLQVRKEINSVSHLEEKQNLVIKTNDDFSKLESILTEQFGTFAANSSEKRIDRMLQKQYEDSGILKGLFTGLALGVGATIALIGSKKFS